MQVGLTRVAARVLWYEGAAFAALLGLLWANEILDLPHRLGSAATPINWLELSLETGVLVVVATLSLVITRALLGRIRQLEGFLHICSFCKRVKVDERWIAIESYVRNRSEVDFSHGLCPSCLQEHYGITLGTDSASKRS